MFVRTLARVVYVYLVCLVWNTVCSRIMLYMFMDCVDLCLSHQMCVLHLRAPEASIRNLHITHAAHTAAPVGGATTQTLQTFTHTLHTTYATQCASR